MNTKPVAGFHARFTIKGWQVFYESSTGHTIELPPRNDIHDHSPDGFAWGYEGSGPAQLALAILAYVDEEAAYPEAYQDFKKQVIANIPQNHGWSISLEDVQQWLKEYKENHATN